MADFAGMTPLSKQALVSAVLVWSHILPETFIFTLDSGGDEKKETNCVYSFNFDL